MLDVGESVLFLAVAGSRASNPRKGLNERWPSLGADRGVCVWQRWGGGNRECTGLLPELPEALTPVAVV